jgi:hypothetical protein
MILSVRIRPANPGVRHRRRAGRAAFRESGRSRSPPRYQFSATDILRGRSSNRQIDALTQARAIELLRQPEWHYFGPTFASKQLAKRHAILNHARLFATAASSALIVELSSTAVV